MSNLTNPLHVILTINLHFIATLVKHLLLLISIINPQCFDSFNESESISLLSDSNQYLPRQCTKCSLYCIYVKVV